MPKPTKAELVALMGHIENVIKERKLWLTTAEFAQLAGRHIRTIQHDCASGHLPAQQTRKHGKYLIHYQQLLTYTPSERAA